jgi:ketosteroid isomerase-like protein
LPAGSRDSEHVADPTADPELPVNRSAEVEALAVQWMALLKADDAAAAISLISPDEATFPAGSGPADCYPGGRAFIEHVREAVTASGLPFEPGAPAGWADGDVGWFAGQVTLAFPQNAISLRMTGVAVREEGRWRLVQVRLSAAVTGEALLAG